MRKFIILVKKEIKELLTPQMLVPLVLVVVLFAGLGKVVGKQAQNSQAPQPLALVDLDKSDVSAGLVEVLSKTFKVESFKDSNNFEQTLKEKKISLGLIVPAGFGTGLMDGKPQEILSYNILTNFSLLGSRSAGLQQVAVAVVNDYSSNLLIAHKIPSSNPATIKNPITAKSIVVIGNKSAEANPSQVLGYINQQTAFIPIILFLVIVLASQMVAVAMAQEKENKTLETLLSAPVSRNSIIAAKLVGAGIASFLMAGVYMFGFRYYLSGLTSLAPSASSATSALQQLGLVLAPIDYVLLGTSLFFGILAALSVAIILAAFVEDVKSVQAVITPLMVLIMIPYFLVLFLDFTALPALAQYAVYLIPFSHPFLASQNIFFHNYTSIIYGIVYELLFFAVFVWLASKLFSSDKLLTLKFSFKKRH